MGDGGVWFPTVVEADVCGSREGIWGLEKAPSWNGFRSPVHTIDNGQAQEQAAWVEVGWCEPCVNRAGLRLTFVNQRHAKAIQSLGRSRLVCLSPDSGKTTEIRAVWTVHSCLCLAQLSATVPERHKRGNDRGSVVLCSS